VKKGIIFILLIVFLVFTSTEIVFAYSGSQVFGGKIINTKATKIQELESSGYICTVYGSSITIRSIKGPTTYVIPATTIAKTRTIPAVGKWIMGKYSGKTMVTCTKAGDPPLTTMVTLDTITLFGTS
jgi:hypothetical protein